VEGWQVKATKWKCCGGSGEREGLKLRVGRERNQSADNELASRRSFSIEARIHLHRLLRGTVAATGQAGMARRETTPKVSGVSALGRCGDMDGVGRDVVLSSDSSTLLKTQTQAWVSIDPCNETATAPPFPPTASMPDCYAEEQPFAVHEVVIRTKPVCASHSIMHVFPSSHPFLHRPSYPALRN